MGCRRGAVPPGREADPGVTYFRNDFENLIDFDSGTSKYENVAEASTGGVELFASLRPLDGLTVRVGYTYTDTEDKTTGEELIRRPRNKFRFDSNCRFLEKGNVNLGGALHREEGRHGLLHMALQAGGTGRLCSVDLAASYRITGNVQIFGRIENLFDADYEEANGYGTPGISATGGSSSLISGNGPARRRGLPSRKVVVIVIVLFAFAGSWLGKRILYGPERRGPGGRSPPAPGSRSGRLRADRFAGPEHHGNPFHAGPGGSGRGGHPLLQFPPRGPDQGQDRGIRRSVIRSGRRAESGSCRPPSGT
jgi:hypothetical protein